MSDRGEMVEFVVNPGLLPGLVDWLDGRGLDFVQGPPHEDAEPDALRWFIVSPRLMR